MFLKSPYKLFTQLWQLKMKGSVDKIQVITVHMSLEEQRRMVTFSNIN